MRRVIIAAIAVAAALSVGPVGAYFAAQSDVPENIIRVGALGVSTEPTSAALSIDPIAPGETSERSLHVVNTGTLPLDASLSCAKKAGFTDVYSALTCRVTSGGRLLYDGPLADLRSAALRIAAGERATLLVAIGLPADAPNALQGKYVKLTAYVHAEQAR